MPSRIVNLLRRYLKRAAGASMLEFALLTGLVALAALAGVAQYSGMLDAAFVRSASALSAADGAAATAPDTPEPPPEGAMVLIYAGTEAGFSVAGADLEIAWGDGATDTVFGSPADPVTHAYAGAGPHRAVLTGTADSFASTSFDTLAAVRSFGDLGLSSLAGAFAGATALESLAPLPGSVTDISGLLRYAAADPDGLAQWDVAGVTDAAEAFRGTTALAADLSGWATGSITDFSGMFRATQAPSPAIGGWDMGSATTAARMFQNAASFDADLSGWEMSGVTDTTAMFRGAAAFTSDLAGWEVGAVAAMDSMFRGATAFTSDLSAWCVENIATRPADFAPEAQIAAEPLWGYCGPPAADSATLTATYQGSAAKLRLVEATGVIAWGDGTAATVDTAGATGADQVLTHSYADTGVSHRVVFDGSAERFANESPATLTAVANFGDLGLKNLNAAFYGATNLESVAALPASVTALRSTFREVATNPAGVEVWDVANVTEFYATFRDAPNFNRDLSGWATASATRMDEMFNGATAFDQDISEWSTGKVTDMTRMFFEAESFNADISGWNTAAVTGDGMHAMFRNADLFDRNLSAWCVENIASRPTYFAPEAQLAAEPLWGECGPPAAGEDALRAVYKGDGAGLILHNATGIIRWGDGVAERVSTGTEYPGTYLTHSYADTSTEHEVVFTGTLSGGSDRLSFERPENLLKVTSFGDIGVERLYKGFEGVTRLTSVPATLPSSVTSLRRLFENATSNPANIGSWSVRNVSDMAKMLTGASGFSANLSQWCVEDIPSRPADFAAAGLDFYAPLWGNCGHPAAGAGALRATYKGPRSGLIMQNATGIIRWGDGTAEKVNTPESYPENYLTHSYADTGVEHEVVFTGTLSGDNDRLSFEKPAYLLGVASFGDIEPERLVKGFQDTGQLTQVPASLPASVTGIAKIFDNSRANPAAVAGWDTSNITTMNRAFRNAPNFSRDISGWATANVANMTAMFRNAGSFTADLSDWCVERIGSRPTDFAAGAPLAAEPNWGYCRTPDAGADALQATYQGPTARMILSGAKGVVDWGDGTYESIDTQGSTPNLISHDYADGSGTEYDVVFEGSASRFSADGSDTLIGMTSFGELGLTSLYKGFYETSSLREVPRELPESITSIDRLFQNMTSNPAGMEYWDTSNIETAAAVFLNATYFNQDIGAWDFSGIPSETHGAGVDNLVDMFHNATRFSQSLTAWCVPAFADRPEDFATNSGLSASDMPVWGSNFCPGT